MHAVFFTWKLLQAQVSQKQKQKPWACIKVVACAVYLHVHLATYLVLIQTFSSSVYWEIKVGVITAFLSKLDHRPLFKYINHKNIIVWGLVSITSTMHTTHTRTVTPTACTTGCNTLHVKIYIAIFNHCCFTQS